MDLAKLRRYYGQLKGMERFVRAAQWVSTEFIEDYNTLVETIGEELAEELPQFRSQTNVRYTDDGRRMCQAKFTDEKLSQLVSFLEYGFALGQQTIEIGSIYNSIQDAELQSRCSDLLSAPANFDRVINQATQVLEDRIRKVTGADSAQTGVTLVNTQFQTDISRTPFVLSPEKEEHEGYCHILRGIMMAYRNPTHHVVLDRVTREEALILCSFVDIFLKIVDQAHKR